MTGHLGAGATPVEDRRTWREDAGQQGSGVRDRGLYDLRSGFEALIFGYYNQEGLRFAAKTRNGFTTASRSALITKMTPLVTDQFPFQVAGERRWAILAEQLKYDRYQADVKRLEKRITSYSHK